MNAPLLNPLTAEPMTAELMAAKLAVVKPPCTAPVADESVFENDLQQFGPDSALALAELSEPLAQLNRSYRQQVQNRGLSTCPEITRWIGCQVTVFLRHDQVYIFAVVCAHRCGMANRVRLADATLFVDPVGRTQTISQRGTLPNRSTVHAFIRGTLVEISDDSPEEDLAEWSPVIYRPAENSEFIIESNRSAVTHAQRVLMIPGRIKVWGQGVGRRSFDPTESAVKFVPRSASPNGFVS